MTEKEIRQEIRNCSLYVGLMLIAAGAVWGIANVFHTGHVKNRLEEKIDALTPQTQEEQVFGDTTPEKFYMVNGKRCYFEVDGKPVDEYFNERK